MNIASELVADPAMLFLDEPTSGLDSNTAFNLLKSMKDIAADGRTLVATLHQPSSQMFQMFDNLLLMAEGHVCLLFHHPYVFY